MLTKVIHFHVKIISRARGESIIGFSSYCSGETLRSNYTGEVYRHNRNDVLYTQILLPANAPKVYAEREALWNAVEAAEGPNGQLARAIDIGLPIEVGQERQIEMLTTYVQHTFVDQGMCADIAIHDAKVGNPHAHICLTMRAISSDGHWLPKWKKNYKLDAVGHKMRNGKGSYICGPNISTTDWSDRGKVEQWRSQWAEMCNHEIEQTHAPVRYTHESYARQGILKEPQVYLGPKAYAMKKRGIETDRSIQNKEVMKKRERKLQRDRSLPREHAEHHF